MRFDGGKYSTVNYDVLFNDRYLMRRKFVRYKYYFKKPKSQIGKDILYWLLVGGAVCVAITSPYFFLNLFRGVKKWQPYKSQRRNVSDAFKRLKKQGCIKIERRNNQIYISLTEKGKKMAGWLQVDALKIKKPKKWDGSWKLILFDISELKRGHREAFRGKLKELGFYPFQKSVWIHPFDCRDEIELLRKFFGLNQQELRVVVSKDIGPDKRLKEIFRVT